MFNWPKALGAVFHQSQPQTAFTYRFFFTIFNFSLNIFLPLLALLMFNSNINIWMTKCSTLFASETPRPIFLGTARHKWGSETKTGLRLFIQLHLLSKCQLRIHLISILSSHKQKCYVFFSVSDILFQPSS